MRLSVYFDRILNKKTSPLLFRSNDIIAARMQIRGVWGHNPQIYDMSYILITICR